MRFLIDECLSLGLVTTANHAGYEAQHVVRIGKAGWMDWNVVAHAVAGDFILVTNNADDFRKLYTQQTLHPGIIIIVPSVMITQQTTLFRAAIKALAGMDEPVNKLMELGFEGDEVKLSFYDLPKT